MAHPMGESKRDGLRVDQTDTLKTCMWQGLCRYLHPGIVLLKAFRQRGPGLEPTSTN